MKKVILALCLVALVVVACDPKIAKTPTPPAPAAETTAFTGNSEAGGALISSAKCTKCHDDKTAHVAKHTFEEQDKLMQAMAKKAELSPQETADLLEYVKTNAKKS